MAILISKPSACIPVRSTSEVLNMSWCIETRDNQILWLSGKSLFAALRSDNKMPFVFAANVLKVTAVPIPR